MRVPVLSEHRTSTPWEHQYRGLGDPLGRYYRQGFNRREFLHNSLLFGKIRSSDSQSGSRDDWQPHRHTHNQEDQEVMKEVVRAILGGSKVEVVENALDVVRSRKYQAGQIELTPIHAMRIQRTTTTSREVPGMVSMLRLIWIMCTNF